MGSIIFFHVVLPALIFTGAGAAIYLLTGGFTR